MLVSELKNPFGEVYSSFYVDLDNKILRSNWQGYFGPEEVEIGSNEMLAIFEKYQLKYILNDDYKVKGPWHDVSGEYLANIWIPAMAKLGLLRYAFIMAKDAFAAESIKVVMEKYVNETLPFEANVFLNETEAMAWLLRVE